MPHLKRGRPPKKDRSAFYDALPSMEQLATFPLVDLVELRPSREQGGGPIERYDELFAHHPDVTAIPLHNSPEAIAKDFYHLRMKGIQAGKERRWNTQFTWSMAMYGKQAGLDPKVIDAIKGYHSLRLRAYSERQQQNSNEEGDEGQGGGASSSRVIKPSGPITERGRKRQKYLKEWTAKNKVYIAQIKVDLRRAKEESAPQIRRANRVLEKVMKQLRFKLKKGRPEPLDIEEALREIIFMYPSVRQASYAVRAYMHRERYTPDEIHLAMGARGRYNRAFRLQRIRWTKIQLQGGGGAHGGRSKRGKDPIGGAIDPSTSVNKEQSLSGPSREESKASPGPPGDEPKIPSPSGAELPRLDATSWWDDVRDWQ